MNHTKKNKKRLKKGKYNLPALKCLDHLLGLSDAIIELRQERNKKYTSLPTLHDQFLDTLNKD